MAAPLFTTASGRLWHAGHVLVVMVGLPARGKTHIARALCRYMRWLGVRTRVFSLGDYRRQAIGSAQELPEGYFDWNNQSHEILVARRKVLETCEKDIERFFTDVKQGGQMAIYDANNGTVADRKEVRSRFEALGVHVMIVENICDDRSIIDANIRSVKISSPDYNGWDPEAAVKDYWRRIKVQEERYETVSDPSFPYVKIINAGERIAMSNVTGYLQSRIGFFLMNAHTRGRTIFLARNGASIIEHSYKADSSLSESGFAYARALAEAMLGIKRSSSSAPPSAETSPAIGTLPDPSSPTSESRHLPEKRPLVVWTSARRRGYQSAAPLQEHGIQVVQRPEMSEMNPGVVDGMSDEEIQSKFPDLWAEGQRDPYGTRYPRGESIHDLCHRLESTMFSLEHERNDLLIIGHQSVLKCLFAYLFDISAQEIERVNIPRGEILEITPTAYTSHLTYHHFWPPEGQTPAQRKAIEATTRLQRESARRAENLGAPPSVNAGAAADTLAGRAGTAAASSTRAKVSSRSRSRDGRIKQEEINVGL